MAKSQREKGAAGEREAAMMLNEAFGFTAKRKLGQARDGGDDLEGTAPFRVEVKRRARIGQIYEWLNQVEFDAKPGEVPIVMARSDGQDWFIAMTFDAFEKLVKHG